MNRSEKDLERQELESKADVLDLIDSYFPSLVATAGELLGHTDGTTLFDQAAIRSGRFEEYGGFMDQTRANEK